MYAQKSAEQGPHRGSSFDSVNSEAKPLNNEVTFSKIDGNQDNRSISTGKTTSAEKCVATIIFSLRNEVGGLVKVLKLFQEKHVNLIHIESRKSKRRDSDFEIFVDCDTDNEQLKELTQQLRKHADIIEISPSETSAHPDDAFTAEEVRTWGMVFRELNKLYPSHACKEYLKNLPLLSKHCNYSEDNIPQLDDVSHFLKERTGFSIRPVAGYLSPRDFLAGLAFRVFHCTQYVRHSSNPLYTPEPDTCHELLGHVPLFAEPSFAEFSQEIGLASLGASDEAVQKLATCYFFTVEFGLCKQDGRLRAYGAGLLSSIGELKHALSGKACILPFDPMVTSNQKCMITTFQDAYFVSDSFEEAKNKMREFAKTIQRPFTVRYNPYTQSVDVLKDTNSINSMVKDIRHELDIVEDALNRLNA
ncbi:Tryptophan 5-hydroxylase [Larimichthys crocea]|uniref:Tryptophan 5-hydroxylase n=1 Tax=Larimichthys crocea TaxID=215358 RepID=A0A6G0J0F7_LARCR|nr:Tryptophan 5-hydroxylase [Larimichthys crocea]